MPAPNAPAPAMPRPTATSRVVLHVCSTITGCCSTTTVDGGGTIGVVTTRGGGAGGGVTGVASATGSSDGTTTQRLPPLPTEISVFHGLAFGASATITWLPGS